MRTKAEAAEGRGQRFRGAVAGRVPRPGRRHTATSSSRTSWTRTTSPTARLIRHQCEQARLRSNSNRYKELQKLIEPLVAKFNKPLKPLPKAITGAEFRRGFLHLTVDFLSMSNVDSLPARFTNLFRDGWIELMTLTAGINVGELVNGATGLKSLLAQVGAHRRAPRGLWTRRSWLLW